MSAAAVALGFLVGVSLGLLGGGGSILTVPIFVYVMGFAPKEAIAMSLAVVGTTSLVGAVDHWREGHVRLRVAAVFGLVAALGTIAGTRVAARLSGTDQLTLLAAVMLVAAAVMLRGRGSEQGPRPRFSPALITVMTLRGVSVGVLTGIIGIGGGFLIVPALVSGGLTMAEAVGTSLLVIAMNCLTGFFGHVGQIRIAWMPVMLLTGAAIPGIAAGTYAMRWVSAQALRRGFALLLVSVAGYILYQGS